VILGAGPAGLGAAWQLARRRFDVTVIDRAPMAGGNAGSFELAGMRVDYGSHRLHPACAPEILTDIRRMLGPDLLDRPRHGRIRLRGRWIHFPLKPLDLALALPPAFMAGVVVDAVRRGRNGTDETFATVLERGLGRTICRDFYFPYAEKIWGVPPSDLDAEQARRRVSANSLGKMVRKVLHAVPGAKPPGSGRFFYPRRGYGQISDAYLQEALAHGARVMFSTQVREIGTEGPGVMVRLQTPDRAEEIAATHVLSTIPLPALVSLARPPAPDEVIGSSRSLRYRSMILVYLVLDAAQFSEYDAHYFPGRDVAITRLSEPKNYGLAGPPGRTVLCAEIPCAVNDGLWRKSDRELADVVSGALESAALPIRHPIVHVVARRLPQAYPIYTRDYRRHFERIDRWASTLGRVTTFGRQGLFAHDNTHHALAMAYAASGCLNDDGDFDNERWAEHRRQFETHVVED
jgi:protoporphyrinogen oxidase